MKVNYMISTAAVLAALLTFSCTKDLQENAPVSGKDSDKVTLLIAADEVTKTTFGDDYEVKWEDASDKIGLFIASSSTNVPASLTRNEAGKAYFEATVSEYASGDKLCAYYPYADKAGTDASKVTLKIPYIQTQAEANKFNGANNPMIAVPVALPSAENVTDGTVVIQEQLKFRHVGAILEFDITGVPSGEKLKSVQFVSSNGTPAGDMTYNIAEVSEKDMPEPTVSDNHSGITVTLSSSEVAGDAKVYMVLIPGTYTGNICVQTDNGRYSYPNLKIEAVRAEVKTITVNLNNYKTTKEIRSEQDYEAFVSAVNAGAYSAWVDNGEVKLGADISTDGNFTRIQKDWDGTFNGQGHTITQNNTTVPLFTAIGKEGVVKNLNLEGKLKQASYPSGPSTAAVAQINRGTIKDVTNGIDINLTGIDVSYMIGGMVIMNGGLMEGCTQVGNITVDYNVTKPITVKVNNKDVTKYRVVTYIGGVACFAADAAEYATDESKVNVGTFRNCANYGNITINKTGVANSYLGKFAMGGICAIVQNGTAEAHPLFEGCRNEGKIVRKDASNGLNACSAIGGIVGRASSYYKLSDDSAFDVDNYNVYLKISDCHNTGDIECSAFLTNGWALGSSTSGARMGATGGIIGYVNGFAEVPAIITDCTSTCTISGGHSNQSVLLGGIAGMTSRTTIENCAAVTNFVDSSLGLDNQKVAVVGGVIGYVRHDSAITGGQYSAVIAMPETTVADIGICAGGSYVGKTPQILTVTNAKFCGSIAHKGLETPVTVTAENLGDNLVSFGKCNKEGGITYWAK